MKITLIYGEHYDQVLVDGEPLDPGPSQRLFNHSPDGFSWGYGGSGPAQLALALLMKAGVPDEEAVRLHQQFKNEFVALWPQGGTLTYGIDVLGWAREQQDRVAAFEIWQSEEFDGGIRGYNPGATWRKVWASSLTIGAGVTDLQTLDVLFASFQRIDDDRTTPNGYNGRSLTEGDVIKLNDRWYFCAFKGWAEIEPGREPVEHERQEA